MHGFPPGYHVDGATWVYLSAVLITAIYFRFSRVWSLRNLDLALMLAAPPGLLLVRQPEWEQLGFVWLFVTSGLFLVRLLIDPWLQRRPVLGQNLNAAGLGFLGIATLVLLTSAAIQRELPSATARVIEDSQRLLGLQDAGAARNVAKAAEGVPAALTTATLPPPPQRSMPAKRR